MNGTVARRIRKEIYGDMSLREMRQYSALTKVKERIIKNKQGTEERVAFPRNTALSTGLCCKYRLARKAYKAAMRNGKRK